MSEEKEKGEDSLLLQCLFISVNQMHKFKFAIHCTRGIGRYVFENGKIMYSSYHEAPIVQRVSAYEAVS